MDKSTLIDNILQERWNLAKDFLEGAKSKLSSEEFEKELNPLAVSIELVKAVGKPGLNLAKEYADNIFSYSNEKDSTFTDGVYTLDRNKSGVPFEMEPQNGPYPRALPTIEKGVGDISTFGRISFNKAFDIYIINIGESQLKFIIVATVKDANTIYYKQFENFYDVDWLLYGMKKEEIVAYVQIFTSGGKQGISKVYYGSGLFVDKDYRRQGIATAMYNEFEKQKSIKLVPEAIQSPEGEEFWKSRKSFSLDYLNKIASALRQYSQRTGSVLDNLKPLATLWYENEDGDKYILSEEELRNVDIPEDYPYQHSRNPELREMVCVESAPPLMEGGTTMNCIGPIVISLVQDKNWDWVDALVFAASTCSRCFNILLEEVTGEPYLERDTANTFCECCEMIDPEYDTYYKTVIKPEQDKVLEEEFVPFVGMRDLVAYSGKYKKVWIDPSDEIIEFDITFAHSDIIKKFLPNSDQYKTSDDAYDAAISDGWIRKGETGSLLYFFVNELDDQAILRMQKYIDNDPDSLVDKEIVDIDFGRRGAGNINVSAEAVEKYGLKSAIQRSERQLVNAFSLADLITSSESLMLTPKSQDLAPQVDWRYPERQEVNPSGHRPFMVNDRPHKELVETNEDSHIFFFGPSFNQHLKKYNSIPINDLVKQD